MELATITELIGTLGFPIACVLALGFFIWKIYQQSVKREEKLMSEIAENRSVNAKAIETIALYAERLTHIEGNIEEIKADVSTIKDNMQ